MGIFLGVCTTGETKRSTSKTTLVGSLPGLSQKEASYNPATQDQFGRHVVFDALIGFLQLCSICPFEIHGFRISKSRLVSQPITRYNRLISRVPY